MVTVSVSSFVVFFFLSLFIYFKKESTHGGGAEREGERIPSRLRTVGVQSNVGLELRNLEITT